MRDGTSLLTIVRVIGRILHKSIHDVITIGTQSAIVYAGNRQINERTLTDPINFGLIESLNQVINRVTIDMDCTAQQLLSGQFVILKSFEFRQLFQSHIDLCGSSVILDVFQLIIDFF
jgi:hypothetical protein